MFNIDLSTISDDSISIVENNLDSESVETLGKVPTTVTQGDDQGQEAKSKPKEATIADDVLDPDLISIEDNNNDDTVVKEPKEKKTAPLADPNEIGAVDEDISPGTDENSSPITPFTSFLQEKGFLPNFNQEEFDKSENKIEALADAMRNEINAANESFIKSFPPEMIEMAEAVANGVDFNSLKESKVKELTYSKITDEALSENEGIQKQVVSEYLATKGFKPEKIKTYIDRFEDSGTLEEEAAEALVEMKEYSIEQQKLTAKQHAEQQAKFQERHKQELNNIAELINKTEEIVPGLKLNKPQRDKLYNNMTQIVGQDEHGQNQNLVMKTRAADPYKFDMAVNYLLDVTKGFTDWSSLGKTAKTSATKEFEKVLSQNNVGGYGKGTPKASATNANIVQAEKALIDSIASFKL